MKKIYTTILLLAAAIAGNAQPMISSGFVTGMAAINGTTYTKTGMIGVGNYQYICGSKTGTMFASSFTTERLYWVNPSTSTITDSMSATMYDISSSNENDMLFAVGNNDALYKVNTATKTITDSTTLAGCWRLEERPGTKELWVSADGKVYVVDYTSGLSSTSFTLPVSTFDGGGIRFTTGGSKAYMSSGVTNKLYKMDAATKTVTDSASTVRTGSYCAEVSHDSSKVFVSFPNGKCIYVYSAATLACTDSILSSRAIFMIYRHPIRHEIWAVNHFNDSVTVYNEDTKAQIAAFGISSSPHHLAFSNGAAAVNNVASMQAEVLLYPNPAHNSITVLLPDNKKRTLVITDIYGKQMKTQELNGTNATVDVSAMATGSYSLSVIEGNKVVRSMKWTKE